MIKNKLQFHGFFMNFKIGMMMDPRRGGGRAGGIPNFDPVHPGMPSPFGGPPGPMPPGFRPRGGGPSARGGRGGGSFGWKRLGI